MTGIQQVHPAIPAFTVGFRLPKTGEEDVKSWVAKKLKVRQPGRVWKWLNRQIAEAETALDALRPIKTHPNVELARRNAQAQMDWAKAVKKELAKQKLTLKARPRRQPPRRRRLRRDRTRVGTLAREAVAFGSHSKPEGGNDFSD